MKYNSCLLDRLYIVPNAVICKYTFSVTFYAFHAQKREKKGCCAYKRSCTYFCMKIENIKARCASNVCMLERSRSTKRPRMTWVLHRGTGTGLTTGPTQTHGSERSLVAVQNQNQNQNPPVLHEAHTEGLHTTAKSCKVTVSNKQTTSLQRT